MLKPFDARVVVQKPQKEQQTESGIFLPDTVDEQSQTAQGGKDQDSNEKTCR